MGNDASGGVSVDELRYAREQLDYARGDAREAKSFAVKAGAHATELVQMASGLEWALRGLWEKAAEALNVQFAAGGVTVDDMVEKAFGVVGALCPDHEETLELREKVTNVLQTLQSPGGSLAVFMGYRMVTLRPTGPAWLALGNDAGFVPSEMEPADLVKIAVPIAGDEPAIVRPERIALGEAVITERYKALQARLLRETEGGVDEWTMRQAILDCSANVRAFHAADMSGDEETQALERRLKEKFGDHIDQLLRLKADPSQYVSYGSLTADFQTLIKVIDEARHLCGEKVESVIDDIAGRYASIVRPSILETEDYVMVLTEIIACNNGIAEVKDPLVAASERTLARDAAVKKL